MAVRVLIVSPDTGFGGLILQTLERSGEYEPVLVSTGRQALELAKQVRVDLAILDEDTADLKVGELGPVLLVINSEMRIVLIPADEPDRLKKSAGMQINGYLTKPFYLPDLVDILDSALAEVPAAETVDDSRETDELAPEGGGKEHTSLNTVPQAAAGEDASWMGDINLAAQHLARLTMSTSSQAALVLRQNKLWAYAGQLSREAANELANIVQHSWQPGREGERGSAGRDIDLARFVHLKTTGKEHLLYATNLESDNLLVLAFDARTPFSEIRVQANSLAAALASPPQQDLYSLATHPTDAAVMSTPAAEVEYKHDMGWALEFDPWQEEQFEDEEGINLWDYQGEAVGVASSQEHSRQTAAQGLSPQHTFGSAAHTATWDKEDDPDSTQPVRVNEAKTAGEPAASAAIFDLHYACILVPRLPEHYLIGDLATQLSHWMRRLSLAFGWRLEYLAMRPGWLQWIAGVEPDTSAEHVVRVIRRSTSDLIFAEFPRYAVENPSDDFWALGYLVITSQKPLPGDIVKGFIDRIRLRQGVSGED